MTARLSRTRLFLLADELSARDRAIIETVGRFSAVSGSQVERLCFAGSGKPASNARLARRALARLVEQRALVRLARRIGGVRAGSAGSVYRLGAVGERLLRYWQGTDAPARAARHEPGQLFVRHTTAIVEVYVRLREAERDGALELLSFEPEPASWRRFAGPGGGTRTLKPDAHAVIGLGEYEDRYFLELDCGTEGSGALNSQAQTHLTYFRSGVEQNAHGVFPRIVWITTTERRAALIANVCARLPAEAWPLFAVTTEAQARDLFLGRLDPAAVAPGRAT
jgi:hypothetical protein